MLLSRASQRRGLLRSQDCTPGALTGISGKDTAFRAGAWVTSRKTPSLQFWEGGPEAGDPPLTPAGTGRVRPGSRQNGDVTVHLVPTHRGGGLRHTHGG